MELTICLVCGYRRTGKDMLYMMLSNLSSEQNKSSGFKWYIYKHPSLSRKLTDFAQQRTIVRTAFADSLKQEASEIYKIPYVINDNQKDIKQFIHPSTNEIVSVRDIYIELGTLRRLDDIDYWCKKALAPLLIVKIQILCVW